MDPFYKKIILRNLKKFAMKSISKKNSILALLDKIRKVQGNLKKLMESKWKISTNWKMGYSLEKLEKIQENLGHNFS